MVIVNDMNVVFNDFIFMIEFSRVLFFDCKIFSFYDGFVCRIFDI